MVEFRFLFHLGHSLAPFAMQNNAESNIYPTMVKQERHGHEAFIGENFPEGRNISAE